jgi:hypothetical protein
MSTTTRSDLHRLVDDLDDAELDAVAQSLRSIMRSGRTVLAEKRSIVVAPAIASEDRLRGVFLADR